MLVVGQGDRRRGLHRARHHQPGVLAHLAQVGHQVGVAGEEARPARRPGWTAWTASGRPPRPRSPRLEDRAGRPVPGELAVALVGEHRHAVGPPPPRRRPQVVRPPVGLAGELAHSSRARSASAGSMAARSRPARRRRPAGRARPGSRPAGPHGVGRVRRRPGTGRCRGRVAAGASSWAAEATNSLVPTQAATCAGADRHARSGGPAMPAAACAAGGRSRPTAGSPARSRAGQRPQRPRPAAGRTGCRSSSRPCRRAAPPASAARARQPVVGVGRELEAPGSPRTSAGGSAAGPSPGSPCTRTRRSGPGRPRPATTWTMRRLVAVLAGRPPRPPGGRRPARRPGTRGSRGLDHPVADPQAVGHRAHAARRCPRRSPAETATAPS